MPGLVLLYYLTDQLGVSAAVAGLVVAAPRFLDLVVNPLVGRLSDRTRTRWGSRRPWMAAGGLLFPLAFAVMFASPSDGAAAATWVAVSFAVAGLAFSAFVVPWAALPADLGADSAARSRMTAWRIGFTAVAILASGGLAPTVVELAGGGRAGYAVMAVAFGAVMLVAVAVAVGLGARRSTSRPTATTSASWRDLVSALRRHPSLRATYLVIVACEIAAVGALAAAPYLAEHVLRVDVAPLFVALVLPLLLTMPLWHRAASRHGKRAALAVAAGLFATGAAALVALPFVPSGAALTLAVGALAVAGTGFAGTSMLPAAMLSDAVVVEAARSGRSQAGLLTGAANAAETIGAGLGAGLYAAVLSVTGFVSTTGVPVVQSPGAQVGIVGGVAGISLVAMAGVVAALRRHTLTEADIDRITAAR